VSEKGEETDPTPPPPPPPLTTTSSSEDTNALQRALRTAFFVPDSFFLTGTCLLVVAIVGTCLLVGPWLVVLVVRI